MEEETKSHSDFNALLKEVKEKENKVRDKIGGFFLDLAKASFTAMVVGATVSFFTQAEMKSY